jgi:surfeit locus 1 family protein
MQFRYRNQTYAFVFKTGFFLFILPFVILCLLLGDWQLHRYHYKENLLLNYQQRLASTAKVFSQITESSINLQFQPITADGYYINKLTMLVQNQFYKDQIGFEVLTPMRITGEKKLVLVDRGWIKAFEDRTAPVLAKVNNEQHIKGYIKLLNEYQFTLGKNILDPHNFPIIMQKIDINEINHITKQSFYPFIIRLNAASPNGFIRNWNIISVLPQRHMAYAVQWFIMAVTLAIAFFIFCCRRTYDAE